MTPDPACDPAWPAFRAACQEAWDEAGATDAARAALVGAIVEQGCPGAWRGAATAGTDLAARPNVPRALLVPELAGLVLEALLAPDARQRRGAHHTPADIARRVVALALDGWPKGASAVPTVCDPAVGGGAFLLAAARELVERGHALGEVLRALHGADIDPLAVATARASLRWWASESVRSAGDDRGDGFDGARGLGGTDGPCEVGGEGPTGPGVTDLSHDAGGTGPDGLGGADGPVWRRPAGWRPGGFAGLEAQIVTADGLAADAATWAVDGFDVVVGNPPFLSQLGATTARGGAGRDDARERFGLRGYADSAGLFLLAGVGLARAGGRVAMIQPESFLATRDAAPIRDRLLASGSLTDLWVAVDRVFGADVRVCAPVLTVSSPPTAERAQAAASVRLWRGRGFDAAGVGTVGAAPGWGSLVASVHGTPAVLVDPAAGTLGDLATATAGFRDQFYGLAPHVVEASDPAAAGLAPLVTSGAIDPLTCRWGERPTRFAGRRWDRPAVDLVALAAADPTLARWVRDRLVPKVLVATQTRVVEAVADPEGRFVPSVPVVAVACAPADVWRVAAVLLAPVTTAWALHHAGGTALTGDAVKLSARQVLEIPLPVDPSSWAVAASGLAAGTLDAATFAAAMAVAYGLPDDDPVTDWWLARLPSWPAPLAPATG